MTKLLTSTAIGLIAAFAVQAQAQDSNSQTAQLEDPCTAQWVAVDENNDGTISKSEAQNATEAQFSQIDRDGDGMISIKNWKDCTVPSAIPGGFQSAEGTGTERTPPGALTEGETAGTADSGQQDTSEQAQATDEAGQQDSQSTRALQATPEVSGVAETPADWSEEMFADVDTDLSGYITAEEAGEWTRNRVTGTMDDEETIGRYGAMFSMIDEDGDGRITQEEWQARDQMDVESRFGRIDQDGDGQVSQSEWRDYREQRFGQARQDMQQQDQEQAQAQQDTQQGQDQEQAQADAGQEPTIWLYYFRSL